MLALKGYEQSNGFSVMNTDELFFINGGCGMGPSTHITFYDFVKEAVLNAFPDRNEYAESKAEEIASKFR